MLTRVCVCAPHSLTARRLHPFLSSLNFIYSSLFFFFFFIFLKRHFNSFQIEISPLQLFDATIYSLLDPEDRISDILKSSPTVSNDYVHHLNQVSKKTRQQQILLNSISHQFVRKLIKINTLFFLTFHVFPFSCHRKENPTNNKRK